MAEQNRVLASETEARDVAEAARESEWEHPSFVRELFLGRFRLDLIDPHPPVRNAEEEARAKPFMDKLEAFPGASTPRRSTARARSPKRSSRSCARWAPSASRFRRSTAGWDSRR